MIAPLDTWIFRSWRILGLLAIIAGGLLLPSTSEGQGRQPRGLSPEIEGLLQRMLGVYAKATSYRDDGRLSIQQFKGRIRQLTRMPSSVAFERPNKIRIIGGGQTATSDGSRLQIVLDGLRQYTETPAPETLSMKDLGAGAPGAGVDEGYPEVLAFLLRGERVFDEWMSHIASIEIVDYPEPKTITGRPCHVVYYETKYKAKISLYIDQETSILLRFDVDGTEAQLPAGGPQRDPSIPLPTLRVACQLDPVIIDQGFDQGEEFAITVPAGMRRVERFRDEMMPEANFPDPGDSEGLGPSPGVHPLQGKPAPSIADLEDKTSLVLFWSTKAGPGNLIAVALAQRIADHFTEDPDVTVLGITTQTDTQDAIDGVLQAKKATFKNISDADGALLRGFQISGLPTFYVLDRDRKIRHAVSGAEATLESELREKIDELRQP